jgi:hypothetical protein
MRPLVLSVNHLHVLKETLVPRPLSGNLIHREQWISDPVTTCSSRYSWMGGLMTPIGHRSSRRVALLGPQASRA